MARLTFKQFEKQTVKQIKAKSGTIRIGTRSQLRSLVKNLGFQLPKGESSFTVKGTPLEIRRIFGRIGGRVDIGIGGGGKTRVIGLLTGDKTKLTLEVGKADIIGSKGKRLQIGENIDHRDPKQLINFGLRQDGTPRKGYTLAQCYFSYAFRRAGSRGKYRYNGYNSILNQTRIQIEKNINRSGGKRTKGARSVK